jgi:oligoendopeptidase F
MNQPGTDSLLITHNEWNLRPLFEGDDDPRMEEKRKIVEQRSYEFINRWKDRSDYLEDPSILKEALDEYEAWRRYYGSEGDEGYYFMLRHSQDQNDPNLKAKLNKIDEFSKRIENDIQFFYLRIARIRPEDQKIFLDYPGLSQYRHYLERVFAESRYLLSEPEEKIMNLKSTTSHSNWVRMTSSFLSKEERAVLDEDGNRKIMSFSEIASLMNSKKKKVRDSAARAFNSIMDENVDVAEAEINSILGNKKVDDELRKISRPDLSRHLHDDIDSGVVDALLQSVSDRFDISSRYYALKAKLMKVKKLRYHDRNVEYGKIDRKYPFHEAMNLVYVVMKNLDGEFADILAGFVENGQIDAFPRKGKASGAFCAHSLISQPTYVLLNHTDKLNDVLTVAHELGHGINNELIRKKQNALNFGSPTSTAEVASTFMEDFVLEEIMRQADDELRLSLMMMKLNDDVSSIFRQVSCYRFEQELHRGFRDKGYLSKEEIGGIFRKHMAAYMGDSVEQSAGSENWWVYWGHIRYFFYVYSYASGLLISKALQNSVKQDPSFIVKVKDFLSAGLSDSPQNIFRKLGVDIRDAQFWNKGLDEIDHLLNETTALARKLGNIR